MTGRERTEGTECHTILRIARRVELEQGRRTVVIVSALNQRFSYVSFYLGTIIQFVFTVKRGSCWVPPDFFFFFLWIVPPIKSCFLFLQLKHFVPDFKNKKQKQRKKIKKYSYVKTKRQEICIDSMSPMTKTSQHCNSLNQLYLEH